MFEPGAGQHLVHERELRLADLLVHGPQRAPRRTPPESRIGFDRQMVCRNMRRRQLQRTLETPPQRVGPETRHAEDQVDRNILETSALRIAHRTLGLRGVVTAVHHPQARVVERLDADRQPVDSRPAQGVEVAGRQVVGIGLHRDLLHGRAVETGGGAADQTAQRLGSAQRRRPAAEIECPDPPVVQIAAPRLQFAAHRGEGRLHARKVGAADEVAIGADPLAERYVEIDARHDHQR